MYIFNIKNSFQMPYIPPLPSDKFLRDNKLLEHEKAAQEKDYILEATLHQEQQRRKQEVSLYTLSFRTNFFLK